MSLIPPEELVARLDDPALRIADVRWWLSDPAKGRRDYEAGHIPGAVFVDVDRDLVGDDGPGRHPLPSPAAFAARMAAMGFGDAHEIVAYDDAGGSIAARLWWMLDALGHPAVRVLDGGIQGWVAAGGPLVASIPDRPPATLTLRDAWPRTIDRSALRARLGQMVLVDVRAPERYRGEVEPVDPVAGHIPTAVNHPTAGNLGPDGRFLEPVALRLRYAPLGNDVVVSCGSGINACHAALAMRVAGLPDPVLYPGSYSDWSTAGFPVVTEPAAGAPGASGRGSGRTSP